TCTPCCRRRCGRSCGTWWGRTSRCWRLARRRRRVTRSCARRRRCCWSCRVRRPPTLHGPATMLAGDPTGHPEPQHRQTDGEPGEGADTGAECRARPDDARLRDVARAHEERVDRGLGLVLGVARRRQEERLAHGVLERVVGAV